MPKKVILLLSLVVLITVLATSLVVAQSGGAFGLTWSTVDGGGGRSSGGNFDLSGTVGQPDASSWSSGGTFTLSGGFWQDSIPTTTTTFHYVYLPVVVK